MIATILQFVAGNLLEVIGGASGLLGIIVGVMFGGRGKKTMVAKHEAAEAKLEAKMLKSEIELRKELQNAQADDLAARISRPE